MAIYPEAKWRPIPGHTDGPMHSHTGAVLHVNESDGNLFGWVSGDHDVSCHFEVYKDGSMEQYLDTAVSSWCQMDGNADYISIETEGYHTEPLTSKQWHAIARLLAWLHVEHGIELKLAEKPGDPGFGWHGMGGAAWGGHTMCPGDKRRAERHGMLVRARAIVAGKGGPAHHPPTPATPPKHPTPVAPQQGELVDGIKPARYAYELVTEIGDKHNRVYAAAPGHFEPVDVHEMNALIKVGLADNLIMRLIPTTFRRLRRVTTGGTK